MINHVIIVMFFFRNLEQHHEWGNYIKQVFCPWKELLLHMIIDEFTKEKLTLLGIRTNNGD